MPIGLPAGSRIYASRKPVDMRKGFDGLAAQVQHLQSRDPFSAHLFLFRSRGGDRVKALWWDGSGLCLFVKRLERQDAALAAHLAGVSGFLQADAYPGFDKLYGDQIIDVGCWAHARRKVFDVDESTKSPIAAAALAKIGEFYRIEENWPRRLIGPSRMRIRSPLTVQQMQPLVISKISSSPATTRSLSMPISPNSLKICRRRDTGQHGHGDL